MAVGVKPIEKSLEKWERRSAQAAQDYVTGTDSPRRPWAASAAAAEANYKQAVIAAANGNRFGAGVRKAGDAKWKRNIDRKGSANYQTGVAGAGQDWADGSRPYQQAVANLNLPPRGAKNSAENYRRSQMTGDTQAKLRQAMLSGTR